MADRPQYRAQPWVVILLLVVGLLPRVSAVDGDTLVVGAPLEDSAATGVNGTQHDNSAFNAADDYGDRPDRRPD